MPHSLRRSRGIAPAWRQLLGLNVQTMARAKGETPISFTINRSDPTCMLMHSTNYQNCHQISCNTENLNVILQETTDICIRCSCQRMQQLSSCSHTIANIGTSHPLGTRTVLCYYFMAIQLFEYSHMHHRGGQMTPNVIFAHRIQPIRSELHEQKPMACSPSLCSPTL